MVVMRFPDTGRFKGIAVVRNDIDRAQLEQLARQGVIGVAWNASLLGVAHYAQAGDLLRLLADLDMLLSLLRVWIPK